MKRLSQILLVLHLVNVDASTLFVPDSDTAALITLVSNTASTVSNTLKILEVAEKTSEQMDKYNFLAMRRYFVARRIEQHVNDIQAVSNMKADNLKELNREMFNLKMNLKGLKSNIDFMAVDVFKAQEFTDRFMDKIANSFEDETEAHRQEIMSANQGSTSKHVQNTAMNTAMSTKILTKIRRDNIEYQKNDIALKKGEAIERLRREEFYKKWLGVNKSEEIPPEAIL
jgi:hypothetical protein